MRRDSTVRDAPRRIDRPEPGFFLIKLIKGGPECPAAIRHEPTRDPDTGAPLDRSFWWSVEINGRPYKEPALDPHDAGVDRVWLSGRRIDAAEYRFRLARVQHAERWHRDLPEANPNDPIDLNKLPPLFARRT